MSTDIFSPTSIWSSHLMDWALIGKRIRNRRLQRNLTQEQLATYADTSNIYISKIENGIANPTLPILNNISEALGCSLAYIIDGTSIITYDQNARIICKLLDGCSPYMVKLISRIVRSLKEDEVSETI